MRPGRKGRGCPGGIPISHARSTRSSRRPCSADGKRNLIWLQYPDGTMISRFRRLKNDFRTGWAKVRQGTAKAANRSLEEMELLRLKYQLYKVEDEIKEHLRAAGERAFQLIERKGSAMLEDKEIHDRFAKRYQLKQEEARIRFDMGQIKEQG